ncbi:protein flightless-1 [Ischnura elegans]|uniref:protein flightless-1 n=1 Tax=Ischnura elegans TaxID=197161 RepID=UPI001ED86A86|nr:protein flightless-1 [Ischnura elegans]
MACTGVLPFVRGVDFTKNDFSSGQFPESVRLMTGVQWLKLDRTGLKEIPEELGKLQKLEHLSLVRNNIERLHGEVTLLPCLRSLNVRHNKVRASGVPPDLFRPDELSSLDLSHNCLREVPEGLDRARSLLVLNLSHNKIENIPNSLFVHLSDLLYLDLGHNCLETLPPQTRRLANLHTLVLNHNPLGHFQLRQLPSLVSLETLHLRATQRAQHNMPQSLEMLTRLADIDLSCNGLASLPECLFTLRSLRRLNVSDNCISEMPSAIDLWQNLETLNVCRNRLTALPASLCRLTMIRRLLLNDNLLDFDGIPSGIGKLSALEVFSAAYNRLEMIPEGLCRCGSLRKLVLRGNRLVTLPDTVHLLTDLEVLDLRDNPGLILPPRPCPSGEDTESSSASHADSTAARLRYYNIDFSLRNQLRLAGAMPPGAPRQSEQGTPAKDAVARKLRLRRGISRGGTAGGGGRDEVDGDQAKILKGMKDVARDNIDAADSGRDQGNRVDSLKPRRWDEALERPPLDYSEFFEEEVKEREGLFVWEVENFLPSPVEEAAIGKFYEGDCYVVLRSTRDLETGGLNRQIFFWIGEKATLDKRACAAIHAVNLRNWLGARCRTQREEMGDESPEFLALFINDDLDDSEDGESSGGIVYVRGGRTPSGFYTVEEASYPTRLYRIHTVGSAVHLEPMAPKSSSLDVGHVFLLDIGKKLFTWAGLKSKNTLRSKARLVAEKIDRNERKNGAEIVTEIAGQESSEFWRILGHEDGMPPAPNSGIPKEEVDNTYVPRGCRLYRVRLGTGYLELPQVEPVAESMLAPGGTFKAPHARPLTPALLASRGVYILDCYADIFVWFGKKSTRLVRAAAMKLCQELFVMIKRPGHALVTRVQEGTETQIFKSKFAGWDDIVAVDFTRTAESVRRTGADLVEWAKRQETKADLAALFAPRQPLMPVAEARALAEEWNEDLEAMEAFVLEGRKFVRLPEEELGHFYSGDCYVFLCRYWVPPGGDDDGVEGNEEVPDDDEEECFQCVVYFWQGREASNMGWLTFTFSLRRKFAGLFGEKLEVVRTHQQQENLKFMAHFRQKFIIHKGKRRNLLDMLIRKEKEKAEQLAAEQARIAEEEAKKETEASATGKGGRAGSKERDGDDDSKEDSSSKDESSISKSGSNSKSGSKEPSAEKELPKMWWEEDTDEDSKLRESPPKETAVEKVEEKKYWFEEDDEETKPEEPPPKQPSVEKKYWWEEDDEEGKSGADGSKGEAERESSAGDADTKDSVVSEGMNGDENEREGSSEQDPSAPFIPRPPSMPKSLEPESEPVVKEVVKEKTPEKSKTPAIYKRPWLISCTDDGVSGVELFHLRSNGGPLCTRCIQINPEASALNSAFCYILKVPFGEGGGVVYIWIGSKSDTDEAGLVEEIAREMYGGEDGLGLQVIHEGSEPENFFWVGLGGRGPYEKDATFMLHSRLFRCSNERGYFTVSEKCSDFCQDDLADDDIMILDNGEQVFLWLGAKCSEVEIKLAFKSAQVYVQHLRAKQPEMPRKLFLTLKGKESRRFSKCFHGWGPHKIALE